MVSGAESRKASGIVDQQLAKALAHPLRAEILAEINLRVMSPKDFAAEYGGSLSKTAYHFRVLEKFGCLEVVEEVKRRGAVEHRYRATGRGVLSDEDWMRLPRVVRRGLTSSGLRDFLGRATQAIEADTFDAREDRHFSWTALVVDEEGWKRLVSILEATLAEVLEVEVETADRMAASGEDSIAATFAIAGFESPKVASRKG